MEEHAVTHWVYLMASLLLSASMMLPINERKRAIFMRIARSVTAYFYSLSPVVLLVYLLFAVSHIR
jgi:hypothetical protein